MNRREFLKRSAGFAGMALTGLAIHPAQTWSRPTRLKITDIRGCTVASNFDYPLIKIYTNQDVYGLGEVRDAGYLGQALILKTYLVGKDPLDIEGIMESLRPYARNGRFGGGFGVPPSDGVGPRKRGTPDCSTKQRRNEVTFHEST